MYERFYNLRERPFSLTPDPDYLYPSRFHRETLNYLRYGIEGHAGFVVITGEIGSGKTTLLQTALRGLDHQTSVARLINTNLDARELIESVMLDFGLDPQPGQSKPYLLRQLASFLVAQRNAGRLALLVIDEAQNLAPGALEEVRMLSNIETEKSKLLQVVMVGQPSLRTLLGAPQLEQLRQRITVSYHLQPLDLADTHAYLNHRIRRASLGAPVEFREDVSEIIHRYSNGIPRTINVIADALLLFGYADERHELTTALANEVIGELKSTGVIRAPQDAPASETPTDAVVATPPAAPQAPPSPVPPGFTGGFTTGFPTGSATAPLVYPPSDHERDLQAREARLAQRERELAEQRRVVSENLRLLRVEQTALAARHASTPAPATTAALTPTAATAGPVRPSTPPATRVGGASQPPRRVAPPPNTPLPGALRQAGPRPPAPRQATGTAARPRYELRPSEPRAQGLHAFWAWLRRSMLGVNKPAVLEDQ